MGLKTLLSTIGLGQSDLTHVFKETLKRVNDRDLLTADQRGGASIGILEMLNVLRDEEVMSTDTFKELQAVLVKWKASQQPKRIK